MSDTECHRVNKNDPEVLTAIALAVQLELELLAKKIKQIENPNQLTNTPWKNEMHSEVLLSRQNLPLRRL